MARRLLFLAVVFRPFLGQLPGEDLGDAGTLHLVHAQQVAVQAHLVSDLGGAAQVAEDETADGVEVLALELRAQGLVDDPYRDAAVYRVGAVREFADRGLLLVELVPDLVYGAVLRNYEDLAREVAGGEVGVETTLRLDGAQHVLDVNGADDP